jgi:cytochrome c-type biogenesis protein CcmE
VIRYRRFVIPAVALIGVVAFLLFNLSNNLVFFNTPTELHDEGARDSRLRLGGQVVEGSVASTSDGVTFEVTDGRQSVVVVHSGAPQQLFAEGRGVIVEGEWDGATFHSDSMLVKHDEQYRTEDSVYETPTEAGSVP